MGLRLIRPTVGLHAAFLDCRADWGPGAHEDGFGLGDEDVVSPEGFAAWVRAILARDGVHGTLRWIVEDGRVLGAIALRHVPNAFGHIGYGVRPSARRRGVATWALGEILGEARALGMDHVVLVCAEGNVASVRTIEHHGGVLTDTRVTAHGPARYYRIALSTVEVGAYGRHGAMPLPEGTGSEAVREGRQDH